MSISVFDCQDMPVAERIQLVEDLWDSIASETPDSVAITDAQREEIRRRVTEHDANPASAVGWDAVRKELFQQNR
jgi:putative addiction module component (TIGR02574 family)